MKNDVTELIVVKKEPDKDGFEADTREVLEVLAEIKSVKRSEFYQAARDGINVQLAAVVNLNDMEAAAITENGKKRKPTMVRYNGTDYKIVREYRTTKTKVELTLQEVE